jgi:hypothetical protein
MAYEPIYRLPDPAQLDMVLRGTGNEQVRAARKLKGAIEKQLASLTPEGRTKVQTEVGWSAKQIADFLQKQDKAETGLGWFEHKYFRQLLESIQKHGAADVTIHPGTRDKRTMNDGEARVLAEIVDGIGQVVGEIGTGKHDTCLANVFGAAQVEIAKEMFLASYKALVGLQQGGKVVVDEVSKLAVWRCGGLTSPSSMTLPPSTLKECSAKSITEVAHEMTHAIAGGRHTGDKFYRHHAGFPIAREARKLVTASYYEEVFARILAKQLPGDVLVAKPQKGMAYDRTEIPLLKQYQSRANIVVNRAWATAVNIYDELRASAEHGEKSELPRGFFDKEKSFQAIFGATHMAFCQHASQLLGLTIHRRASMATDKRNLVSRLDLSLLDNKLSVMGQLQTAIKETLSLPPDIKVYDEQLEDRVLREALIAINGNREAPGTLSKNVQKDIVVIRSLAALNDAPKWPNMVANLTKGLPEPMKSWVDRGGANAVHVV